MITKLLVDLDDETTEMLKAYDKSGIEVFNPILLGQMIKAHLIKLKSGDTLKGRSHKK